MRLLCPKQLSPVRNAPMGNPFAAAAGGTAMSFLDQIKMGKRGKGTGNQEGNAAADSNALPPPPPLASAPVSFLDAIKSRRKE